MFLLFNLAVLLLTGVVVWWVRDGAVGPVAVSFFSREILHP
jgi:hypothetical protein